MIPLALLALVSIYIFIERAIAVSRASRQDASFMQRIKDYIHDGEIESAQNLCRQTNSPYARMIAKGISKGLSWLATTAAGAPMLGFLGTVVGMVQAFYAIASSGNTASIGDFAGGIYTALVTTVAGLIVGIVALFAYNILVARINKVMNIMEARTMDFMDILNEPA